MSFWAPSILALGTTLLDFFKYVSAKARNLRLSLFKGGSFPCSSQPGKRIGGGSIASCLPLPLPFLDAFIGGGLASSESESDANGSALRNLGW